MKCFAYIRVSTTRQRDEGVSLEAQRASIERYARVNDLTVSEWFTETKTAASRGGRVEFDRLLKRLRKGEAEGVIVHKIDRSARNLRDYADFASLIEDYGIAIHIAAESLDLTSRGGRLSADIQAVVAADYIRNLKAEARKGIQGRYRQGLLPGIAPLGYLNNGGGKPKTIDPVKGPLVRELFERYATGDYSFENLVRVMGKRGLTNRRGNPLDKNAIARIFNQPFYYGLIYVKRTGETHEGIHEPLITKRLYDTCLALIDGKRQRITRRRHPYTFRKLITCSLCERRLIAERQKGHVYYRCHTRGCPVRCIREEAVESQLKALWAQTRISEEGADAVKAHVHELNARSQKHQEGQRSALQLQYDQLSDRLSHLTDLLIDGVVDKAIFAEKKQRLLNERAALRDEINRTEEDDHRAVQRAEKVLELAKSPWLSYKTGSHYHKRRSLEMLTSNLSASPENVVIEPSTPFALLAQREGVLFGGPYRDAPRTEALAATPNNLSSDKCDSYSNVDREAELTKLASQLLEWAKTQKDESGVNLPGEVSDVT